MYSAKFENDNGNVFYFDNNHSIVFDMNVGDGLQVDIGTSQGFSQVGETVENHSVGGRPIEVKGVIYKNIDAIKRGMRRAFYPFASGVLTINGKYTIRVYVKETPSFSPLNDDGRFTMLLFAPYPYFYDGEENVFFIGKIEPAFSFPVNYSEPHYFGIRGEEKSVNVYNDGDVETGASFRIVCYGESTNAIIQNLNTLEFLKINGELQADDVLNVYRAKNGSLRAELTRDGEKMDVLSWIDEGSNLFSLYVGDNLISVNDEEGANNIYAQVAFKTTVVAAYED